MEDSGTGFDKIMEDYKGADENRKPYIYSTSDHFTLVLPDLTYQNGLENKNLPILNFIPVSNGSKFDEKILSFCYYNAQKNSDIAKFLNLSDSSYLRKTILENLEKEGYLIKSKISGMTYYKTNPKSVVKL